MATNRRLEGDAMSNQKKLAATLIALNQIKVEASDPSISNMVEAGRVLERIVRLAKDAVEDSGWHCHGIPPDEDDHA